MKSKRILNFACLECGYEFKEYPNGLFVGNYGIMVLPNCPECNSYETYTFRDGKRNYLFEAEYKQGLL